MRVPGAAKPLAALSSGLLARKGQARPAMRPQGFASMSGSPTPADARLDDLGWNDMGPGDAPPAAAEVPPVLVARAALVHEVSGPAPVAVVAPPPPPPPPGISLATAARIGRESAGQTKKGKAAFTLRLEPERHLRLRLASAVAHQSAQALVAQALDHFLTTMPEVDALAAQLPQPKGSR
jgi:hypothetical protein